MTDHTGLAHVRGFNYQPSYHFNGLYIWSFFRPDLVREELGRGKRHFPGMNTIRAWLGWEAYLDDPERFADNFETYLSIAGEHGLRVIPTLFNGWFSVPPFGGIAVEQLLRQAHKEVFLDYIRAVVGGHANDGRVLAWDLCNEPFNNARVTVQEPTPRRRMRDWLAWLAEHCKGFGEQVPICVGTNSTHTLRMVEPFCDVLTDHIYYAPRTFDMTKDDFREHVEASVALADEAAKPLLVTECCWGSLDDAERVEWGRFSLEVFKEYDVGFLPHLLHHTQVADGHRPHDGPIGPAGYMAFIEADGYLRAGHEFFNEF